MDTLDHHVIAIFFYFCRTLRWISDVIFFLLDVIRFNSFIFLPSVTPSILQSNANRQHLLHLERLLKQLVEIAINKIMLEWQSNNTYGVQRSIVEAAIHKVYYQLRHSIQNSIHTKRYWSLLSLH